MEYLPVLLVAIVPAAVVVWVILKRRSRIRGVEAEVFVARSGRNLDDGLERSRRALGVAVRSVIGLADGGDHLWKGLEEVLLAADMGPEMAHRVVERVRMARPSDSASAERLLRDELVAGLSGSDRGLHLSNRPAVVMVVGANGTGKTTSIAKLARRLKEDGMSVLLGSADTFRAAADTQLGVWAERASVELVGGSPGGDPAAVAFDAYVAARARGRDVVIVDTAGRLHSKQDLMAELGKIRRVLEREAGSVDEVLLVLDASGGQNGVAQARAFADATGLTGIILTKLDGTAKGGVVIHIEQELGVPVKYIGVGEAMEDLIAFDPQEFVDALIGNG